MLEDLRLHQREILQTMQAAETILIAASDPDVTGLGQLRWRMAQQISAYKALKENQIFPSLIRSRDDVAARLACDMKARCDTSAAFYRRFLSDWTALTVIERKASYRSAALEIIGRFRRHFKREDSDLVRLINLTRETASGQSCARTSGHRGGF